MKNKNNKLITDEQSIKKKRIKRVFQEMLNKLEIDNLGQDNAVFSMVEKH